MDNLQWINQQLDITLPARRTTDLSRDISVFRRESHHQCTRWCGLTVYIQTVAHIAAFLLSFSFPDPNHVSLQLDTMPLITASEVAALFTSMLLKCSFVNYNLTFPLKLCLVLSELKISSYLLMLIFTSERALFLAYRSLLPLLLSSRSLIYKNKPKFLNI